MEIELRMFFSVVVMTTTVGLLEENMRRQERLFRFLWRDEVQVVGASHQFLAREWIHPELRRCSIDDASLTPR